MDCRGNERRKRLVKRYEIVPVAHVKLLEGQCKKSDAGPIIKDQYYIFKAIEKNNSKNVQSIQCGMGAASDFLRLTNKEGLPLFNPLVMLDSHVVDNSKTSSRKHLKSIRWDPVAKQLHNAIMWTIIACDAYKPDSPLFKIEAELEKSPALKPYNRQIKAVNTIIKKLNHGRTLTDSINKLKNNNNIRKNACDFSLLAQQLHNLNNNNEEPIFF